MADTTAKEREFAQEYPRAACGELKHVELQEYLGMPESTYRRYRDTCIAKGLIDKNYKTPVPTLKDVSNLLSRSPADEIEVDLYLRNLHRLITATMKKYILTAAEHDYFTRAYRNIAIYKNNSIAMSFMSEHEQEFSTALGHLQRIITQQNQSTI